MYVTRCTKHVFYCFHFYFYVYVIMCESTRHNCVEYLDSIIIEQSIKPFIRCLWSTLARLHTKKILLKSIRTVTRTNVSWISDGKLFVRLPKFCWQTDISIVDESVMRFVAGSSEYITIKSRIPTHKSINV